MSDPALPDDGPEDAHTGAADDGDLTRLVDASPTGMALLDADLGLRHANGRWTEFTGQPVGSALEEG